MSGNKIIKEKKKKKNNNNNIKECTLRKSYLHPNKLIHSHNSFKIENDEEYICEYSNELLNENIKLSGIISPFINPIPCFVVKNENSKNEITSRYTFCTNLKTQINFSKNRINLKKENENIQNYEKNENEENTTEIDNNEITKISNKDLKKSFINNKYFRPHSPNIECKKNKLLKSDNFEIRLNNNNNNYSFKDNFESYFNNKNKLPDNINKKNLNNNSNQIFNSIKKQKIINHLYYSTDACLSIMFNQKNDNEEKKENKIRMIKLLGQKINMATMKIEILQNYKKNKNLKSIRKKIEYNKIYCNNDLQRLKDSYYKNIQKHLNQIKYLRIKLLKSEENFMSIYKHKEIINKEELIFKIKKMGLIEKIILIQKKMNDFLNPDSTTNDTYFIDESFEEQTIKDLSVNDYSLVRDTIGVNYQYDTFRINKALFNNDEIYESKIIKIKPNQVNLFSAKFLKTIKEKKVNNKK